MKRPLSMTAFGRGESLSGIRKWTVEIRTVNHRFCDIKIKIPRKYICLEDKIKKDTTALFSRGHIDIMVTQSGGPDDTAQLSVNLPLAKEYYNCLLHIKNQLKIDSSPSLATIAEFKDIITAEDPEEDMDAVWQELKEALAHAMTSCLQMRQNEGLSLKTDLLNRIDLFESTVLSIDEAVPELVSCKKAALKERLDSLLQGVDLDPIRLAQEVAIIADKSDITEELVRLKSHIQQFRAFMDLDEPVGRRLDFLMQEFLREINTMASKINDTSITHKTVALKNEVEQIREQVQNLE